LRKCLAFFLGGGFGFFLPLASVQKKALPCLWRMSPIAVGANKQETNSLPLVLKLLGDTGISLDRGNTHVHLQPARRMRLLPSDNCIG
jgi:hypothetical protein